MSDDGIVFALTPVLFVLMVGIIEVGRRIGMRHLKEETERERDGNNLIEAAIYGLLGLLIAFTVSGAATRLDARRVLTVQEANAIGTAYLRLDLLPEAAQPLLREQLKRYTEARLGVFRSLPDMTASARHAETATALQQKIWSGAIAALRDAPQSATMLVVPALNDMIDITTTRAIASRTHTPLVILGCLGLLAIFSALLTGFTLAGKRTLSSTLHMVGFALVVTMTIYVVLDLDYPRVGLIKLDYVDQAFVDLLAGMK